MAIRVTEAARFLDVSPTTIRRMSDSGELPFSLSIKGQRTYKQEDLQKVLDKHYGRETKEEEKAVFYVRSSSGNDVTMETQVSLLENEYGKPHHIYRDKSSGLRDSRSGLDKMMKDAREKKFTTLYITNNDRLTRFGFHYLEQYFDLCGVKIVILNSQESKEPHEVLMQDFMSLIASFSGKFYRIRGWEQQKKFINKASQQVHENEQK